MIGRFGRIASFPHGILGSLPVTYIHQYVHSTEHSSRLVASVAAAGLPFLAR
jgi:hypothetical protein